MQRTRVYVAGQLAPAPAGGYGGRCCHTFVVLNLSVTEVTWWCAVVRSGSCSALRAGGSCAGKAATGITGLASCSCCGCAQTGAVAL